MLAPAAADLLRSGIAVALAGGIAWIGYAAACRLTERDARTAVRWSAAAIVAAWYQVTVFWLLTPFGGFRLALVLPLTATVAVGVALGTGRAEARAGWARDRARLRELCRALARRPAGWALFGVSGAAAVHWLRGTAAPPLGWDALTYHLYKAGRWVQHGSLAPQPAPDAWSYYEYFPVVGDVFWSWAMLPLRSDVLIATAGLAVWAALVLGVYAAAREVGAPEERSALAAGAVGALPSVLPFLSSAYVDVTVAALFALGSLFVLRAWHRRRIPGAPLADGPLAAAALGLMLGTKPTTAGLFLLGALVAVAGVATAATDARSRRIALLACALAAVAGAPGYQRAWVEQGSPLHPFDVSIGPVVLSEGVAASRAVIEDLDALPGTARLPSRRAFWRAFLSVAEGRDTFLNPGPAGAVVALLGVLGLLALLRRPEHRVAALYLAGCALFVVLFFLSGGMAPFRTTSWVANVGRYATPGFVATAVLAAAWRGSGERSPATVAAWLLAIAASLVLARPRGVVPEELPADFLVAGVAAGLAAALCLGRRLARRRPVLRLAAAGLLAALSLAAVGEVRRAYRYPLYRAAVDSASPIFHMHPLSAGTTAAWPIWRELDRPPDGAAGGSGGFPARRIAVTAGWDGLGHNWYRYPLLGSRLQNDVLYVPITEDGSIVDYREREELARRASSRAWLERLVGERVDYVVSLAPRTTPEDGWMRRTPELFTPTVVVAGDFHALYRFDRAAAAAALAGSSPRNR